MNGKEFFFFYMNTKITIRVYSKTDKPCVLELLKLNTPQYFSEEEEQDFVFFLENEIEQYFVVQKDQTNNRLRRNKL